MASATSSPKRSWRAIWAPREHRVSVSSRSMSPPFCTTFRMARKRLGRTDSRRPYCRISEVHQGWAGPGRPSCGGAWAARSSVRNSWQMRAALLLQPEYPSTASRSRARARLERCPARIERPICWAIQQLRTQWPAGWPSVRSSAWLSAPSSSPRRGPLAAAGARRGRRGGVGPPAESGGHACAPALTASARGRASWASIGVVSAALLFG